MKKFDRTLQIRQKPKFFNQKPKSDCFPSRFVVRIVQGPGHPWAFPRRVLEQASLVLPCSRVMGFVKTNDKNEFCAFVTAPHAKYDGS